MRLPVLLLLLSVVCHPAHASTEVDRLLQKIESAAKASHSDALRIERGRQVLLDYRSADEPEPIELMSVTKSVVALGVGCLLQQGALASLDTPVYQFYPEWNQGRKKSITVRMLMNHSSGLQNVARPAEEIYPAPDVIKLALAAELDADPGTRFSYNNKATNLLAGIIEKASGQRMDHYLDACLLQPLAIERADWFTDDAGNPHVMAGLSLTAEGLARVGRFVLDGGVVDGRQVVSRAFLTEMVAASPVSWEVGLLWWRKPGHVSFHVDQASIDLLRRAESPADIVAAVSAMNGRAFSSAEALYAALAESLGDGWIDHWRDTLIIPHGIGPWAPFHAERGPIEQWQANGSLGQYLVLQPNVDLVAVRQIREDHHHDDHDDYSNFDTDIQALADALAQDEAATPR